MYTDVITRSLIYISLKEDKTRLIFLKDVAGDDRQSLQTTDYASVKIETGVCVNPSCPLGSDLAHLRDESPLVTKLLSEPVGCVGCRL